MREIINKSFHLGNFFIFFFIFYFNIFNFISSTWTPHVLSVTDALFLQESSGSSLRVASVSLDHQLVIYDILNAAIISRITLPQPLRVISSNYLNNFFYLGSTKGHIYIIPLDISSYSLLNSNKETTDLVASATSTASSSNSNNLEALKTIDAHLDSVTGIISINTSTFISISLDGKIKMWDSFSRQCLKVLTPFQGQPINHCKVSNKKFLLYLLDLIYNFFF